MGGPRNGLPSCGGLSFALVAARPPPKGWPIGCTWASSGLAASLVAVFHVWGSFYPVPELR